MKACVAGVNGSPSLATLAGDDTVLTPQCHSRPERSGGEGNPWLGTTPPFPPHRKSGVPDLRKKMPISGKPEMGGEESLSRFMSQPLRSEVSRRRFQRSLE